MAMKVLLGFLFFVFVAGLRAGDRDSPVRRWPLAIASAFVAAGYLSLRVVTS